MIILEGADGSGKTTLAYNICGEFGLEYRRPPEGLLSSVSGPNPGLHEWWRGELRRPVAERDAGVYDRCFWVSEPIYSAVSGRVPLVDGPTLAKGIADLWATGPLMIFCMTDEVAMLENTYAAGRLRLADIGDDQAKFRSISFLYWAAYAVWYEALADVHHYDYIHHPEEELMIWLGKRL